MKKDFVIDNSIALEGEDFYYDIHNCYSVKAIELEKGNNQLRVVFEKGQGSWIKEDDPQTIELHFANVSFFETSHTFSENAPKDIEEMGYKNKGDFDYDYFQTEELSTEDDDFILRFINDDYVRVFADTIQILTR
jgi:hypothetical protein